MKCQLINMDFVINRSINFLVNPSLLSTPSSLLAIGGELEPLTEEEEGEEVGT